MKGSLQTKSNVYYAVLSFKDESGKWRYKWICTGLEVKDNKRKAEAFLNKVLAEYNGINTIQSNDMVFIDFMYHWLETVAGAIEQNTYESYRDIIKRYIEPHFTKNQIKLQRLEPKHIQEFYNGQMKASQTEDGKTKSGLSANSVLKIHANIRKALQHAVKMGMIPFNPADRVTLPKKKQYHANFYTAEQVNTLLGVFEDEAIYPAVLLASFYGLRRREILGLKWEHIDFTANTLTVRDTVVRCGNIKAIDKPRTKNKASHRTLPLFLSMRDYLRSLKRRQAENQLLLGAGYAYNDYVCKQADGTPFAPTYLSSRFGKIVKRKNLPAIRFHDLRHSAASMLLADGHSLKEIQEWLGHGTLATTANIYAHLQFEAKQNMAASLGARIAIGQA
jgi:integrase